MNGLSLIAKLLGIIAISAAVAFWGGRIDRAVQVLQDDMAHVKRTVERLDTYLRPYRDER